MNLEFYKLNTKKLLCNKHQIYQNLYYIYQKIEGRFVTNNLTHKLYNVSVLENYIIFIVKIYLIKNRADHNMKKVRLNRLIFVLFNINFWFLVNYL